MKWEIGKTYKTRDGGHRKLVLRRHPDGRLIVGLGSNDGLLGYREADGKSTVAPESDLINDGEPTSEEREWVARFMEAGGYQASADAIRSGTHSAAFDLSKALSVLRERK